MNLHWFKLNFLWLISIAAIGLAMRASAYFSFLPYEHLLHTHSHIAFLGWVYPTLFLFIVKRFLNKDAILKYRINLQFILTHLVIVGMFIAFLIQGYGFWSILFSSLFQLLNYWFVFSIFTALKNLPPRKNSIAQPFLYVALAALFLSTFGPWAVAVLMVNGLSGTDWYSGAIYFYLHFQYNGWMLFAVLALFFSTIEEKESTNLGQYERYFFLYMTFALLPEYFISLSSISDYSMVRALAIISSILQLTAVYHLFRALMEKRVLIQKVFNSFVLKMLITLVGSAFTLKIMLQTGTLVAQLKTLAFENHAIIIAFMHLILLGVITLFLFSYAAHLRLMFFDRLLNKFGLIVFLSGFIAVQFLLATQFTGWFVFQYGDLLIVFTALMLAGLLVLFGGLWQKSDYQK